MPEYFFEKNVSPMLTSEGFRYQWTTEGVDVPLMHEKRTGHVNLMTKDNWLGADAGVVDRVAY